MTKHETDISSQQNGTTLRENLVRLAGEEVPSEAVTWVYINDADGDDQVRAGAVDLGVEASSGNYRYEIVSGADTDVELGQGTKVVDVGVDCLDQRDQRPGC